MRTITVENNKIVIRDSGVTVRYSLALVRRHLSKLESELATYKEYERLLTPLAVDAATPLCPVCERPESLHPTQTCFGVTPHP